MDLQAFFRNEFSFSSNETAIYLALLVAIPLSAILNGITNPRNRKLYSLIIGTVLQLAVFRKDYKYLILVIHTLIVYVVCRLSRSNCASIVLCLSNCMLIGVNCLNLKDNTKMDSAVVALMLTWKSISFAACYQDGLKTQAELTNDQKIYTIIQLPSFLDYLGYLQFLPTCIFGPCIEYMDYINYMNLQKQYKKIPNSLAQTLISLVESVLFLVVYKFGCLIYFPYTNLRPSPKFYSMAFKSSLAFLFFLFKKASFWALSRSAQNMSGCTYSRSGAFNKLITCNMKGHLLATSSMIRLRNWNMDMKVMVRKYFTERYLNKEPKVHNLANIKVRVILLGIFYVIYGMTAGDFLGLCAEEFLVYIDERMILLIQIYPKSTYSRFMLSKYNRIVLIPSCILVFEYYQAFFNMNFSRFIQYMNSVYYLPVFMLILPCIVLENLILSKVKNQ